MVVLLSVTIKLSMIITILLIMSSPWRCFGLLFAYMTQSNYIFQSSVWVEFFSAFIGLLLIKQKKRKMFKFLMYRKSRTSNQEFHFRFWGIKMTEQVSSGVWILVSKQNLLKWISTLPVTQYEWVPFLYFCIKLYNQMYLSLESTCFQLMDDFLL